MTDQVNIRALAMELLLEITSGKEYSHIALRSVLDKYAYLEKQKRAFLTRLVEGTLENLIYLDYVINRFSKVPVKKMKPVIRTILRMGTYELLFLDSVPESATCNEAVKLAEKKGFRNLKGFVNGVLRNISRNKEEISCPDLTVRYSIPQWMYAQWEKDYGTEQAKEILSSFEGKSPLTVRVNRVAVSPEEMEQIWTQEGISFRKHEKYAYAYELKDVEQLQALPSFQKGYFYVQDLSSMSVAEALDLQEGMEVLDVCAAPGGKSLHVAEILQNTGHVTARDLTDYKVALIEENIEKSGLKNVEAQVFDAKELDEASKEKFDVVLADLPCSGLGIIGRKKEIRYRMDESQEQELAALQREILSVVKQYVKKDGVLLYSTCTMDKMENEENVTWFLQENKDFTLQEMQQIFPVKNVQDGFFYAKLCRNGKEA